MFIYALTLTWNKTNLINNLYPTLQKASDRVNNNLIWFIRDNNSNDNTEETIKSWNNELFVRYFKIGHNKDNYSKCNNYLINKVKEQEKVDIDNDYYLFLNNDITIENENSIKYMLDIMERDRDVGIVGAKLYYPGMDKLIQHFGVAMSPKHGNMPWHVYARERDGGLTKIDKLFQAVTGAFLLMRCRCYEELKDGKMNEGYNWAFDDVDMCLQVNKHQKKKIVCCSRTNIIHYESATLETHPVNKMFMSGNVNLFKKNWYGKYDLDYYDYLKNPTFNAYKS